MAKIRFVGSAIDYQPLADASGGEQREVLLVSQSKGVEELFEEIAKQDLQDLRLSEITDKLAARRLKAAKEKQEAESALKDSEPAKAEARRSAGKSEPLKRYLVDQQTGRIDVLDEGEGELTYKEALLVSASIKGARGQYDDAINLINAAKSWVEGTKGSAEPSKPKEFYVDEETGIIVHDAEQGEFTLSEARTVSASRQRALVPRTEPITPEKLELLKRDMQDELRKNLSEVSQELRREIVPREEEPPFITDDKGELQPNPNAKVPGFYLLLLQLLKQSRQDSAIYRDAEGNVMRLPEWLEVRKFDKEEKRKDARSLALIDLLQEGRKELPSLAQGLRNMARSGEAEQAMKKGGWLKEGERAKTGRCPQCGSDVPYSSIPAIIACEKCGALNFFGSPEQLEAISRQLAPTTQGPTEQRPEGEGAPPAKTNEEPRWQESVTPRMSSSADMAGDTSKGQSGHASPPTSKRSRKTGSAEKR